MQIPRWLELAREFDSENLRDYEVGEELSNNGISIVGRGTGGYVYKRSIPFLIENEIYCLQQMANSELVPQAERFDKYTIRMEDLGIGELVFDANAFMMWMPSLEDALANAHIRHGDITTQAIIIRQNIPYLIDFAEARLWNDPRPNKRPGTDWEWLNKTFMELCKNADTS